MVYRKMTHYPYGQGTRHLYLLHFSKPFGHARHYLGQTARDDIEARVDEHGGPRGAKLTQLAVAAGVELVLAKVWRDAPRCHEQRLKNRGGLSRLCPVCKMESKRGNQRGQEEQAQPGAAGGDDSGPDGVCLQP